MRVFSPSPPASRPASQSGARAAAVECLGLATSTAVVLVGLLLTYDGQTRSFATVRRDLASGKIIDLRHPRTSSDLADRLTMVGSHVEREAVARAIYRRATSDTPLERIGDLARKVPGVPALTPADVSAIKPGTIVRTPEEFATGIRLAVVLFVATFWGAHLLRRWMRAVDDPVLLPIVLMLTGIGVMSMVALRDPLRDTVLTYRFVLGVAAGCALLVAATSVDFEAWPLRRAVALPLSIAFGVVALLLVFGTGPGASGAKVNLFGVQPVEAIRLLVIFALAGYFSRRVEFLREFSQPATRFQPWLRSVRLPRWKDVQPVIVCMMLVLTCFFLQKDLGPALVLSFVFLGLYGVARGRIAFVIAGVAMVAAAMAVAYQLGFPATVRQRVAIWIDPWNNGVRGGDQIAHALWALATGGLWGAGPGLGDPQLIPAGHTDFVLAAVGEDFGFVSVVVVVALYSLLCWRCLRIALRAPGDYTAFLCIGIALGLMVQAFVIAAGVIGILPLSGVVTPFLSYGRSSMLANFAAAGVVLGVARRAGPIREHLTVPVRTLAWVLAAAAAAIVARTGWIQVVRADSIAAAPTLVQQGDGAVRFQYNPRLVAVARLIERGTIFDRNGLPLATSRSAEILAAAPQYRATGIQPSDSCAGATSRCYPLGGVAFHIVGNATYETNWAARNSAFLERDADAQLKGFDDRAQSVALINRRTGRVERAIRRDYRDLVPVLRRRYAASGTDLQLLLTRTRDVHSSIDARLQARAASALEDRIWSGGFARGAAVVLDVETGEALAAVTYPSPEAADMAERDVALPGTPRAERLLDRSRFGLYPPGSAFKLVVAAAALRTPTFNRRETFACARLPDGRVGNYLSGSSRPIRDDPMDHTPHGLVDLHRGLVVSCNAYFAQLALRIGPQALLDAASCFDIDVAQPPTETGLRPTLPYAGYGQGQVLVSPVKMARVAAAIARHGRVPHVRWIAGATRGGDSDTQILSAADAALLSHYMRDVVVSGTARGLASNATAIAGKTGTAEVGNGQAHSWFVGFAPYGGSARRRIAVAVIIENAGYGARSAAPVAGDIVTAARELGLFP
jgi:cell division protein FtsW (lipid II flippase)/cell division protein FtsI/penicillin-binding protein 2